jgi:hypothetical protein
MLQTLDLVLIASPLALVNSSQLAMHEQLLRLDVEV